MHKVTKRNRNIQKEPYKKNQSKSFRITKQQQHKYRFLEAPLVRQADGELKNILKSVKKSQVMRDRKILCKSHVLSCNVDNIAYED